MYEKFINHREFFNLHTLTYLDKSSLDCRTWKELLKNCRVMTCKKLMNQLWDESSMRI